VSASAVLKWHAAKLIEPEVITPGGHLRLDVAKVRARVGELRKRCEDDS
jgi:hypothetical protein